MIDNNERIIVLVSLCESNSTLLPVALPLAVWYYLPRNPAFITVGYVKHRTAPADPERLGRTNSDPLRQRLAEDERAVAHNPVYTFFIVPATR